MAKYIYGFELYQPSVSEVNEIYPAVGKNSEVFTIGDPVACGSAGAYVAGTTATVIGIAAKTVTMSSTNQTVAGVRVPIIPTSPHCTFIGSTNSDLSTLTAIGVSYKLYTASTGKSMVDVASGAQTTASNAAVVTCVGVDPDREGGTGDTGGARLGLWRFVKGINSGTQNN